MPVIRARIVRWVCTIVGVVAIGCDDQSRQAPRDLSSGVAETAYEFAPGECVATFRMITSEDDELASTYSWVLQSDTIDVCETWTGSNYRWKFVTLGTSERESGVYDMTRDLSYDAGYMSVMQQQAVVATDATSTPTLFDSFNTESSLRLAATDDPYYGIRSLGGSAPGGGCCEFLQAAPSRLPEGSTGLQRAVTVPARRFGAVQDGKHTRHGLRRRGVRALVDSAAEEPRGASGVRRFRLTDTHGEHVYVIDPQTELLIGEEMSEADVRTVAQHEWKRTTEGYERDRTIIELRSVDGHRLIGRTSILFTNIRVVEP